MDELDELISMINDDVSKSSQSPIVDEKSTVSPDASPGGILSQILDNKNLTAETKLGYIMDELQNSDFGSSEKDINLALQRKGWSSLKVDDIEGECKKIARTMKEMDDEWFKCSLCEQTYPADKYHCTSCGEEFINLLDLQVHVSHFHVSIGDNDEQVCSSCGKTFGTSKKSLQKHMHEEHICREGHVECPVGCKVLIPAQGEKSAEVSRHISNMHVCDFCGEKTLFLDRHYVGFHGIRDEKEPKHHFSNSSRTNTPLWKSDGGSTKKRRRSRSMERRNSPETTQKSEKNERVVCEFCNLSTPLKGFSCPICPQSFDYYADSLLHLASNHNYKIDFEIECEFCRKHFFLGELKAHVERQHFCPSSHLRCPRDCLALFADETEVMDHIQLMHKVQVKHDTPVDLMAPEVPVGKSGILETPSYPRMSTATGNIDGFNPPNLNVAENFHNFHGPSMGNQKGPPVEISSSHIPPELRFNYSEPDPGFQSGLNMNYPDSHGRSGSELNANYPDSRMRYQPMLHSIPSQRGFPPESQYDQSHDRMFPEVDSDQYNSGAAPISNLNRRMPHEIMVNRSHGRIPTQMSSGSTYGHLPQEGYLPQSFENPHPEMNIGRPFLRPIEPESNWGVYSKPPVPRIQKTRNMNAFENNSNSIEDSVKSSFIAFKQWEEWIDSNGPVSLGLPGYIVHLAPMQRITDPTPARLYLGQPNLKCPDCKFKYPKKLMECNLCNSHFCTRGSFHFHKETVHGIFERSMICGCCEMSFSSVNSMMSHELLNACRVHFECPFNCSVLTNSKEAMNDHILTAHGAACALRSSKMLAFEMSNYLTRLGNSGFSCSECGLDCFPADRWTKCNFCLKSKTHTKHIYVNGIEYLSHMVKRHNLKLPMTLCCSSCSLSCPTMDNFQRHQIQHHGFCVFHQPCPFRPCRAIFPAESQAFKKHMDVCEFRKSASIPHNRGKQSLESSELLPRHREASDYLENYSESTKYPNAKFRCLPNAGSIEDAVHMFRNETFVVETANPPIRDARALLSSRNHPPSRNFGSEDRSNTIKSLMDIDFQGRFKDGTMQAPRKAQFKRAVNEETKCRNCCFRYRPEKLTREFRCGDCDVHFHRIYDLHFHKELVHQQEIEDNSSFFCDLCGNTSMEFTLDSLMNHRVTKHKLCQLHMVCPNQGCETLWGDIDSMKAHSEKYCPKSAKGQGPSFENSANVSANDKSLISSEFDPETLPLEEEIQDVIPEHTPDLCPEEKSEETSATDVDRANPKSHTGQVLPFILSQNHFIMHKLDQKFMGCDDCGKLQPSSTSKFYECKLCPSKQRSEKQFIVHLESVMHLIEEHGFLITHATKSCTNKACADSEGKIATFSKIEEYYKHCIERHQVCPRHYLCPRRCMTIFNDSKMLDLHLTKCRYSFSPKKVVKQKRVSSEVF